MNRVTEYILTETFTLQQLEDTMDAQQIMYDDGLKNKNIDGLISALGGFSTILGLVFTAPTPVAVGAAIAGLISALGSNDLSDLERIVHDGYWDLGTFKRWMKSHPKYNMIKLKVGFIDYKDQGIRFVQHTSIVAAHCIDGGWRTVKI